MHFKIKFKYFVLGETERSAMALLEIVIKDVNDNAPVFEHNSYEIVVNEDAHLQSRVLHMTALDADIGKLTLTL